MTGSTALDSVTPTAVQAADGVLTARAGAWTLTAPGLSTVYEQQTYTVQPSAGGTVGLVNGAGLNFGSLSVNAIGASTTNAMLGSGQVMQLPAGITLSGGGHVVGNLGWAQVAGTTPLSIGLEGKTDILSTGNVTLAVLGQSQLNQAQAGATIGSMFGHNVAINSLGANVPLLAAYTLNLNGAPAAGSTITFMAGLWMQTPAALAGNIGTLALMWQQDWRAVPGYSNLGGKYLILNSDPNFAIDTAGTAIFRGTVTLMQTPVNPTDAATKAYVDAHAGGGGGLVIGTTAGTAGDGSVLAGTLAATNANTTNIAALGTLAALRSDNLSDLASPATARTNLGLGTAAVANIGTTTGTVADGGVVAGHTTSIAANTTAIAANAVIPITNTYTASGALAVTDRLSLVNSSSTCAMTLASGTVDGQDKRIKRLGSGTVTVTANIDGVAGATITANSSAIKEMLHLTWSASLSTWLVSA